MPSHYEITQDTEGYHFTTDAGVSYKIIFSDLSSLFNDYPNIKGRVFSYQFYPQNKLPKGSIKFDIRVKITIAKSIADFFSNKKNLIVFVCDSSDSLEKCRKKLFDKWFFEHNNGGDLEKYDGKVIDQNGDASITNAIIVHKELEDKQYVIETFESLNSEFSLYK